MPQKPAPIADVKSPGQVAPSASSRPIVVANRSVLSADPMMVTSSVASETASVASTARTAKTIKPVEAIVADATPEAPATPIPPSSAEEPAGALDRDADEQATETVSEPSVSSPPKRDAEAESSAAEAEAAAAEETRASELEQMIAEGTYLVPINAVQRKRSRMHVSLFTVLAIVLAIVLLDAVLDAGFIHVPSSIPHTHFFSS